MLMELIEDIYYYSEHGKEKYLTKRIGKWVTEIECSDDKISVSKHHISDFKEFISDEYEFTIANQEQIDDILGSYYNYV